MSERQFTMWSISQATAALPGDTAECGVFDGATSYLICKSRDGKSDSLHHGFDSFEGLSKPEQADIAGVEDAYNWHPNDLSIAESVAKDNLSEFADRLKLYRGWIPDRFREVEDRRFSLVHIDVDLFRPTLDSLEFFYPRLVAGGIIVCDDYGSTWCPGAKEACDSFVATIPQGKMIHLTTGQGIIIKFEM